MKIIIKGTQIDLTSSIKIYIEEKLSVIEKLIPDNYKEVSQARVEVGRPSQHHKKGNVYFAEINLSVGRSLYRATEEDSDVRTAIDKARDEIKTQLRREKEKMIQKRDIE